MGRDGDWFKNTSWTPQIAAKFEAKLAKARHKRQPMTTQAAILGKAGFPDESFALYRRAADLPGLDGDERSLVLAWLAQALIAAGNFGAAVEAARQGTQASAPSERMMRSQRTPEELLAFALRQRGNPGDDAEADALLAKEDPAYREPLEALRGRFVTDDIGGTPYLDIEDVAEAFVVTLHQTDALRDPAELEALFAASPAALAALDRLWCRTPPMFGAFDLLRKRTLFEAGAYVGRVLVRAGGAWEGSMATATVRTGGKSVDPFAIAYEALLRFKPLARSFAEITSP